MVLCVVVAAIAGAGYAATQPASYSADASIGFDTSISELVSGSNGFFGDAERRAATNADSLLLPGVATGAATILGPPWTTDSVHGSYTVAPTGQSDIIKVTATSADAQTAADVANAVVDAAVQQRAAAAHRDALLAKKVVDEQVAKLSKAARFSTSGQALINRQTDLSLAAASPAGDAKVVQNARVPDFAMTTSPIKYAILAGVLGLIIGVGLALLRARLDPRVGTEAELLAIWDLPVLGSLPTDKNLTDRNRSMAAISPLTVARTSLRYAAHGNPAKVIGVMSSVPKEGKTTVAWGLASAAAIEGERVLLIEGDLRMPSLVANWDVETSPGTVAYLSGKAKLSAITRSVSTRGGVEFDVIPAGQALASPLALLRGPDTARLFAEVREQYDFIVVDLPPATLVPDGLAIAGHLDGLVIVGRIWSTRPADFTRLRNLCDDVQTPVFGIVVNGAGTKQADYYGPTV